MQSTRNLFWKLRFEPLDRLYSQRSIKNTELPEIYGSGASFLLVYLETSMFLISTASPPWSNY